MTRVLAIDPGNVESAFALIGADRQPLWCGKVSNTRLLADLPQIAAHAGRVAIEMVASYGMPVGAEVFETCVWVGKFEQRIASDCHPSLVTDLVKRQPVKLHHCHSPKAKDSNVIQALVDRFAPGQPNRGKGTKADPGWFYGFRADVWQAYALAVYVADMIEQETRTDGR